MAGVLHFIPYWGTTVVALASGVAGLLQFGSLALLSRWFAIEPDA
ncbi:hypothetical protein [Nitrosospira multiformis]|nr:hypothetical protein [Nitrosospira multiformis]